MIALLLNIFGRSFGGGNGLRSSRDRSTSATAQACVDPCQHECAPMNHVILTTIVPPCVFNEPVHACNVLLLDGKRVVHIGGLLPPSSQFNILFTVVTTMIIARVPPTSNPRFLDVVYNSGHCTLVELHRRRCSYPRQHYCWNCSQWRWTPVCQARERDGKRGHTTIIAPHASRTVTFFFSCCLSR